MTIKTKYKKIRGLDTGVPRSIKALEPAGARWSPGKANAYAHTGTETNTHNNYKYT